MVLSADAVCKAGNDPALARLPAPWHFHPCLLPRCGFPTANSPSQRSAQLFMCTALTWPCRHDSCIGCIMGRSRTRCLAPQIGSITSFRHTVSDGREPLVPSGCIHRRSFNLPAISKKRSFLLSWTHQFPPCRAVTMRRFVLEPEGLSPDLCPDLSGLSLPTSTLVHEKQPFRLVSCPRTRTPLPCGPIALALYITVPCATTATVPCTFFRMAPAPRKPTCSLRSLPPQDASSERSLALGLRKTSDCSGTGCTDNSAGLKPNRSRHTS